MVKIISVDDNLSFLRKFADAMHVIPDVQLIYQATDGNELIHYLNVNRAIPDIVFVDVNMPKMDGVAVTEYLTDNFPLIKVIALSTYIGKETVEDMLGSGAWGYVCKACLEELKSAVSAVINDTVYISKNIDINSDCRELLMSQRMDKEWIRKEERLSKR